jgi:hypothetical protein
MIDSDPDFPLYFDIVLPMDHQRIWIITVSFRSILFAHIRLWFLLGLDLSLLADLPPDVIIEGDRVAKYLSKVETDDQARSRSHLISRRRKLLLKV